MMHIVGPNYVLPAFEQYQHTQLWHRLINVVAFCWIIPVLQWGWVVWGQDDKKCDSYSSDAKVAFYMAALSVFSSSFFTPLLRQRYLNSCEFSLMQVTDTLSGDMLAALNQLDWQFDILCYGSDGHFKLRLLVCLDKDSEATDLRAYVANKICEHQGEVSEEWSAERLEFQICQRGEEPPAGRISSRGSQDGMPGSTWSSESRVIAAHVDQPVDHPVIPILGANLVPTCLEDIHNSLHREWRCEHEYTIARVLVHNGRGFHNFELEAIHREWSQIDITSSTTITAHPTHHPEEEGPTATSPVEVKSANELRASTESN